MGEARDEWLDALADSMDRNGEQVPGCGVVAMAAQTAWFEAAEMVREHCDPPGIVRVDTRSEETVERVARAMYRQTAATIEANGYQPVGVVEDYLHHARSVLASLLTEGET